MKKLLLILLAALTVVTAAISLCACSDDPSESSGNPGSETTSEITTKLSFKEDIPEYFTAGIPVNVSKLIDYESGSALSVTAKYVSAKNEEGEYLVSGVTFTPDKIGKVTITVRTGDENISKEFTVKVAPPSIVAVREAEILMGEEIDLKTLVSYVDYTANKDYDVKFVAVSFIPVGGDEDEDKIVFSGDKYTFTALGSYELTFKLVNDGGEAEEIMPVYVKRALGENEIDDLSNFNRGFFTPTYASGTITYDDNDHAENSDWSFMLKADATATAESGGHESESYWNQFGLIALEKTINLSESYIELDMKLSPDARNYVGIGFADEGQTTVLYHWTSLEKQGEWVHFSMPYKLVNGNFKYIRIATLHPFRSENPNYNAGNVWLKIDNVRIKNYETPIAKNSIILDIDEAKTNSLKFIVNHDKNLNYINKLPWGSNTTFTVSAKVNDADTVFYGYVEEAAPQIFRIESLNIEIGKGAKLEFAKDTKFVVAGNDDVEFFFAEGITLYYNGERWGKEFVEREISATIDMTSTDPYLKVNVKNASIDFGGKDALGLAVTAYIDGVETLIGGFVEAVNPARLYLSFAHEKGTKLEIAAGTKFIVDNNSDVEIPLKEAVCIYFDGTSWTTDVVEKEISATIDMTSTDPYLKVNVKNATIDFGGEQALNLAVTAYIDDVETLIGGFVEVANPALLYLNFAHEKGTKLEIAAETKFIVVGNPDVEIPLKEAVCIYFDGTNWTTNVVEKEISATIDMTSTDPYLKVNIKNASIDFGGKGALDITVAAYIDDVETTIWGFVEIANPALLYLNFAHEKGTKLEIAAGTKFIVDDNSDVEIPLKEAVCIYFDGTNWTTEFVEKEISATIDMTSTGSYLKVNVRNASIDFGGKDALGLAVTAYIDDVETLIGGFVEVANPALLYLNFTHEKGTKLEIAAGTKFIVDDNSDVEIPLKEAVCIYFDGTSWTTEFVEKEISATIDMTSTGSYLKVNVKNASIDFGGKDALGLAVTAYIDDVETTIWGFVEAVNPALLYLNFAHEKGTKLEIAAGTKFIVDDNSDVEIPLKEAVCIYFDGTSWTTDVVTAD